MRTMENDELRHKEIKWNHKNEKGMEELGKIIWRACEDQLTD